MKKKLTLLMLLLAMASLTQAQSQNEENQNGWKLGLLSDLVKFLDFDVGLNQSVSVNSTSPISIILFKKNQSSNHATGRVYFSEEPGGSSDYCANTTDLSFSHIPNGRLKRKTNFKDMEEISDGWRCIKLDKPLYLSTVEDNVLYNNIAIYYCDLLRDNSTPPITMKESGLVVEKNDNEFTTPEKAGYLLVNTKTIAGFKCDYYAEGVRTFHFGNGDFATFSDGKKDGYDNRKPSSFEKSIGDWQMHVQNGVIIKQENGIRTITYPNGAIGKSGTKVNLIWDVDEDKPNVWRTGIPNDNLYLPGSNTPLPYVEFEYDGSKTDVRGYYELACDGGNRAGNRVYATTMDGSVFAFLQIVDGLPIPAIESDSVIGIKRGVEISSDGQQKTLRLTIKYLNGDSLICGDKVYGSDVVKFGSIHRNGGVLTIKEVNDRSVKILTFPNGDKYVGEFNCKGYPPSTSSSGWDKGGNLLLSVLAWPELEYWNGTLIKANGKRIEYINGKTESQIAAEKKAESAKATAQYNTLCKKYGRQFVDAALKQIPIIGMPEELLKAAFTLEFVRQSGNYKLYRITGLGWKNFGRTLSDSALLYSIWVFNGKVVDVRYWGN